MYGIWDGSKILARFAAPLSFRSNKPIFLSDTLSLRRHSKARTAQRWELTTRLEPLAMGAGALQAHMVESGNTEQMTIIVPQNVEVVKRRTATAIPVVSAAGVGVNTITVTANNGLIPVGSFIRFSNHSKIYMVCADRQGVGAMKIYPNLRLALPGATTFTYREDVIMPATYDTDTVIGMIYEDAILMDPGVVKIVEDI